jgi:acyl carrier protein
MGWTREAVLAEVRDILRRHTEPSQVIDDQTELVADLGVDSLGVMEVVADIEDAFGIHIGDAELRDVVTLADVASAIVKRLDREGCLERSTDAEAS